MPHGLSLLTASGGPALANVDVGDGGVADSVGALPGGCVDVLLFCCCCDLGAGEDLGIQCSNYAYAAVGETCIAAERLSTIFS